MDSTDERRSAAEVKKQNMVTLLPHSFLLRFSVPEIKFLSLMFLEENQNMSSVDHRRYLCKLHFTLQTIGRLASHLKNHLPREAKKKLEIIATEYVKCQVGVVGIRQRLPLIFCSSCNP